MLPSTTEGSPALGRHDTGVAAWAVRWRSGSNISAGPVAQLRPMTSTSMASRAHEGGADLGAGQHGAGQLDGHLALDGQAAAGRSHGPPGAVDGRLGLEEVEDRLDDDQVDAALDQGVGLLLVGVAEVGVGDLAERGELGARADAAGHPPGPVRGGEVVGRLAGEGGGGQVQLAHPVGQAVLGQHRGEGPEGVGLDDVAADLEKDRWTRSTASGRVTTSISLQPSSSGPPKSSAVSSGQLQVGAHGAVEDDDPLARRPSGSRGTVVGAMSPPGYWDDPAPVRPACRLPATGGRKARVV